MIAVSRAEDGSLCVVSGVRRCEIALQVFGTVEGLDLDTGMQVTLRREGDAVVAVSDFTAPADSRRRS